MKPTIKSCLPVILLILISVFVKAQPDDFEIIKKRVIAEIMKGDIDDIRVKSIIENMNDDGSFQGIDYDDLSRTAGFPHRRHTEN
ncbi:MAG: chondroitin lyase, partial [Bacteroidetes bacterium]